MSARPRGVEECQRAEIEGQNSRRHRLLQRNGAEIAVQFAAAGAAVIVNYSSSAEGADRVVQKIVEQGGRAAAVGADVSDAEQRRNLFLQAEAIFGSVDILVNNAGVFRYFPLEEVTETSLQWMFGLMYSAFC